MEEIGNVRILVVDDEYSNVETVLEIIDENIAEVFYAPNGLIAIKLALEERPDLILMDWEMPEMDGIEATKRLKTDDQASDIPVNISTGKNTTDENLQEAFNAGAVDFIRKPFSTLEFTSRIQSTLRLKRQNDTIQQMLKQETAHKQRELTSMATLDFQKASLISDLLQQVERLDRITNFVYATDIKEIQKKLQSQMDLDKSWENFKIHFEEMHEGFFEKLDLAYDMLSIKERKISAYIKMGLGNFEISEITGTSDASLRKAINRLKKKLDHGPKDDIRKFFFEF